LTIIQYTVLKKEIRALLVLFVVVVEERVEKGESLALVESLVARRHAHHRRVSRLTVYVAVGGGGLQLHDHVGWRIWLANERLFAATVAFGQLLHLDARVLGGTHGTILERLERLLLLVGGRRRRIRVLGELGIASGRAVLDDHARALKVDGGKGAREPVGANDDEAHGQAVEPERERALARQEDAKADEHEYERETEDPVGPLHQIDDDRGASGILEGALADSLATVSGTRAILARLCLRGLALVQLVPHDGDEDHGTHDVAASAQAHKDACRV